MDYQIERFESYISGNITYLLQNDRFEQLVLDIFANEDMQES